MKVLSIIQPWASLCVNTDPKTGLAYKRIETRSWNTKYRGELLIHASAGKQYRKLPTDCPMWLNYPQRHLKSIGGLPFGVIIGKVTLVDTIKFNEQDKECLKYYYDHELKLGWELTEQELAFGDYSTGRYGWLLSDPVLFDEPVPAKGKLGLWQFDYKTNQP